MAWLSLKVIIRIFILYLPYVQCLQETKNENLRLFNKNHQTQCKKIHSIPFPRTKKKKVMLTGYPVSAFMDMENRFTSKSDQ